MLATNPCTGQDSVRLTPLSLSNCVTHLLAVTQPVWCIRKLSQRQREEDSRVPEDWGVGVWRWVHGSSNSSCKVTAQPSRTCTTP